jgi:hypothetical protein
MTFSVHKLVLCLFSLVGAVRVTLLWGRRNHSAASGSVVRRQPQPSAPSGNCPWWTLLGLGGIRPGTLWHCRTTLKSILASLWLVELVKAFTGAMSQLSSLFAQFCFLPLPSTGFDPQSILSQIYTVHYTCVTVCVQRTQPIKFLPCCLPREDNQKLNLT